MSTVRTTPSLLASFSRSQIASAAATAADFGILFLFTEAFKVWYVAATAIGALVGAVTNFLMNRHWSFEVSHHGLHGQALRYALVSAVSLVLNTAGVWAVTEGLKIHYAVSVVAVSLIVGFAFNFPLHRYYVFRQEN